MRLASLSLVLSSTVVAACGGGGSSMPDAAIAKDVGFNTPTKTLKANMEGTSGWMEIGDADLSCLNTPSADVATTVAVTLTTHVKDFQAGTTIPKANVTVFPGIDASQAFAAPVMSDTTGQVVLTIPAGQKRLGFKMAGGSSAADGSVTQLDTYLLFQYLDPNMATQTSPDPIQSVSNTTAMLLPALIGENRTPGTGVVAGALRDCQRHEISNFIATVSSTSAMATPLTNADAYYFSPSAKVPVKHGTGSGQADAAREDGLFVVLELPVTNTAYVQLWGFPTAADLTAGTLKLVSELKAPVIADTVITGSFEPLRQ